MIDSVQEILIALQSSNQSIQNEAISDFVSKREQLGPALINTMLSTEYETVRHHAIATIRKLDEHIMPDLVAYIEQRLAKSRTRKEAVEFSIAIGDPAFRAITYIIRKHDRSVGFAFDVLVGASTQAVPHLMNLAQDKDPLVSIQSVYSLTRIGEPAVISIPTLYQALMKTRSYSFRLALGKAFGTFGEMGIKQLLHMFSSSSIDVRRAAVYGLPEIADYGITEMLFEAMNDSAWQVRLAATQKLYGIGWRTRRPDVLQRLHHLEDDPHWRVRREAREAVKWIGQRPERK